jgi:hypothetical protein
VQAEVAEIPDRPVQQVYDSEAGVAGVLDGTDTVRDL